jgi:beta-glucosidase/6-phospho-beta-glucosidase/beta-galactosidase
MDNRGWNHGMHVKMGLYGIDPSDPMKTRKAKKSVAVYGRIAKEKAVGADLRAMYPAPPK